MAAFPLHAPRLKLLLVLATLSLSALCVVLAAELKRARAERVAYGRLTSQPHAGMYVPSFSAKTLEGRGVLVGESADTAPQVLFFFTTTCPYCLASVGAWNGVADSVAAGAAGRAVVVGITLSSFESTRRYASNHGLRFPVVAFPGDRYKRLYRAGSVPVTMVVNPDGRVPWVRVGQFGDRAGVDSLFEALRTRRPPGVPARP